MALCAGNEHVIQNEEFPKNIEVIIGKLDHCAYAGIYEREPVMFNIVYIMILISILWWNIEFIQFCVGFNNKSIAKLKAWITKNIKLRLLTLKYIVMTSTVISSGYKIVGNDVGWLSQIKLSQLG